MLASCPASRMNQNFNANGIPRDSGAVENALDRRFRVNLDRDIDAGRTRISRGCGDEHRRRNCAKKEVSHGLRILKLPVSASELPARLKLGFQAAGGSVGGARASERIG